MNRAIPPSILSVGDYVCELRLSAEGDFESLVVKNSRTDKSVQIAPQMNKPFMANAVRVEGDVIAARFTDSVNEAFSLLNEPPGLPAVIGKKD